MSSKNDITGDKIKTKPSGGHVPRWVGEDIRDAPRTDKDQDNAKESKQAPDTKEQL